MTCMEGGFQAAIDNCCWCCWPSVLQTLLLPELWRIQTARSLYVRHCDSRSLCLVPPPEIQPCVCTGSLQPFLCVCHRKKRKRKEKKKKPTLHIKESCCRRNIPATATKTLPLCVRTSHAQLETAWRRQAVSSFLHFSVPATPLEFRLLIGSSLGRPECRLRSLAVEQKHITVTQLIGYRLVAFSFPLGNVQCFLGVLHKVQRLVRVPKKLCSCAKPNNWVKVSSVSLSSISKTICSPA